MSRFGFDDQLNSAKDGVFSVNSLFSRFSKDVDLSPEDGIPTPAALPVRVHEFIHFMHNISTRSGVKITYLTHAVIAVCVHKFTQVDGTMAGGDDDDLLFFIQNMGYLKGGFVGGAPFFRKEKFLSWKFGQPESFPSPLKNDKTVGYSIKIEGCRGENVVLNETLNVGWSFITEGVAFEAERVCWKNAGVSEDYVREITPSFPYFAYGALVDFLVGRQTTSQERLIVGNIALFHDSPGMALIEACDKLKVGAKEYLDYQAEQISSFERFVKNDLSDYLDEVQKFYADSEYLKDRFSEYSKIIKMAAEKRAKHPHVEEAFIQAGLDVEKFMRYSANFAPHVVIQEKQNGKAELEIVDVDGGLLVSNQERELFGYMVLCSVIHFVSKHIKATGSVSSTDELQPMVCPFSGTCEVEKSEKYPGTCKTTPWKLQRVVTKNQPGVCLYQAALHAIRQAPAPTLITSN